MLDTIKNNIFTTEGRLNRLRYIKYVLALVAGTFLFSLIIFLVIFFIFGKDSIIGTLFQIAMSIFAFAGHIMLQIRRLHDLDKSGWFALLSCIPVINFCFGIYLLFVKGTEGDNQYGKDPLFYN